MARALNDLAETLQREESLRKESVADLAHELRTPVMGLLARIEAAQDGVLDDEAANLAAMHDEAVRLTRLLDDLSLLADAARPGMLLERTPVDLAAVADRQVGAVRRQFEQKGIALSSELEPVVVDGDVERLEQIVANLLSNALRYTDPGGRVVVRVMRGSGDGGPRGRGHGHRHRRGRPRARLRALLAGGEVALAHDRRRGHRARHRPGARARSRRADAVVSAPGEGSTFRVTLPALR